MQNTGLWNPPVQTGEVSGGRPRDAQQTSSSIRGSCCQRNLYIPSPHAALYDCGEFIGCTCSVPSPMTLAFAQSPWARHSQNSHHPFPMGDGFAASLVRCSLRPVELLAPLTDLTGHFAQPTGTFTPELSASRSPFSSSGITTVATERFHRWDFCNMPVYPGALRVADNPPARPASAMILIILSLVTTLIARYPLAVAARSPSSFRLYPPLDVSRLFHTSTSLPEPGT